MLDVIDKGRTSAAHPVPLLFVHGAWHGAWCWDEHFLDFFADKGYRAVAVNLRGHGGRSSSKSLHKLSTVDYLDDVVEAAESLPSPPILIGHSMGGYLVQKFLESRHAPAGVLLAAVPPKGAFPFVWRWAKQRPALISRALITGNNLALLNTPELARDKMFSPHTPESDVVRYTALLQNESRRTSLDMSLKLPKPERVSAPMLVIGAEDDNAFTRAEVEATARAYRTEATIFPGMGHDVMLEPGWQAVAEHIDGWLTAQAL